METILLLVFAYFILDEHVLLPRRLRAKHKIASKR